MCSDLGLINYIYKLEAIVGILFCIGFIWVFARFFKESTYAETEFPTISTKPNKFEDKESIKVDEKIENTIDNEKEQKIEVDINDISWSGNGSGVIISSDGYIATNNHVISDEEKKIKNIGVEFNYNDEIKTFKARVIKTDPQTDLAIIKIEDKSFKKVKPIPFSVKEEDAELGEQVFALGYPMALTIMGSDIKFTDGRISSKTGFQGNVSTYQSTTPIQPGNSGGPLFDYNGNLIGINSSGLDKKIVDNVSYTIKTSYLKNLINVLPKKIVLPKLNTLKNLDETNKIKELTKYVVLIKVELA